MQPERQMRGPAFEVADGFVLPDLADLLPPGGSLDTARSKVVDTYFDTADGTLQRLGVTLRRRVGGSGPGWQLGLPPEVGGLATGYPSNSRGVPEPVNHALAGVRAGGSLAAVLSTTTGSQVTRLRSATGEVKAVVADDQVVAAAAPTPSGTAGWRQIRVETSPDGDPGLVDAVRRRLLASGAQPSSAVTPKWLPDQPDRGDGPSPDTIGGLVRRRLEDQHDRILRGDIALRLHRPVAGSVRVALDRLSSILEVLAPVFDSRRAAALRQELGWYGSLLDDVLDREVLDHRLTVQLTALPPELVLGPVADHSRSVLSEEKELAYGRLQEALTGERYQQLLSELSRWRTAPPVTKKAAEPPTAVKKYLKHAAGQFEQQHTRARLGEVDEQQLDRVREQGSRLRRAAELLVGAPGRKNERALSTAGSLESLLDDYHVSVLSADFLQRVGPVEETPPEHNGFTYGLLYERELRRAATLRRSFEKASG